MILALGCNAIEFARGPAFKSRLSPLFAVYSDVIVALSVGGRFWKMNFCGRWKLTALRGSKLRPRPFSSVLRAAGGSLDM